ncbi:LuxR C-terminal-related transcriptional regulator [Wenyingzhuangia sp. IMCC45467]
MIDKQNIDLYQEVFNTIKDYNKGIVNTHIQKLEELDNFLLPSQSFFILTNTINNTYEFISKNFEKTLGLSIDKMMEEGVSYWFDHHHPKDLEIWLNILNELMSFTMSEVPIEDRKKLSYTWNLRIKNSKGVYVNLHKHQTPIAFDQSGKPIVGISHNTITSENVELPMIASIKKLNDNNEYETIFYKNYSQNLLTDGLSNREKDVLRLLALNYTSKEIADKLCISSHTVDGHRRNIIKKTGLSSTGEIIQYCKNQQLF